MASPSTDAAIPCLRRVLAIDATHGQARQVLGKLLVTEAKTVAAAGNHAEARALATEASQLCPDAQPVWLALVSLTEDPAERIDVLRQAAQAAPQDSLLRTRLRQALLARGVIVAATDRAEARARFREAAALDPSDLRVWQALANLADSTRRTARRAARAAARRAHASARPARARNGRWSPTRGRWPPPDSIAEACERWREAIAFTGGSAEMWLGLAEITGDEEEAERAIAAAHEIAPHDERDGRGDRPPPRGAARSRGHRAPARCVRPLRGGRGDHPAPADRRSRRSTRFSTPCRPRAAEAGRGSRHGRLRFR